MFSLKELLVTVIETLTKTGNGKADGTKPDLVNCSRTCLLNSFNSLYASYGFAKAMNAVAVLINIKSASLTCLTFLRTQQKLGKDRLENPSYQNGQTPKASAFTFHSYPSAGWTAYRNQLHRLRQTFSTVCSWMAGCLAVSSVCYLTLWDTMLSFVDTDV